MATIESLPQEKLERYRQNGLSDKEIELLNTSVSELNRMDLEIALRAKDKM